MPSLEAKLKGKTLDFSASFDVRADKAGRYRDFLVKSEAPPGEEMASDDEDALLAKFFGELQRHAAGKGHVLRWEELPQCARHGRPRKMLDVVMVYCRCSVGFD